MLVTTVNVSGNQGSTTGETAIDAPKLAGGAR